MSWQPIETAPKDGTRILLYIPQHEDPIWTGMCMTGTWFTSYGRAEHPPTHWMPFPPPPGSES